jgi:hypothetical protein
MPHTIPDTFPAEWIDQSEIVVQKGCYPTCTVIRPWNTFTPYVVHRAIFFDDGTIGYEQGDYCRTLEQARDAFNIRTGKIALTD